ncbi:hypothetical protein SAMN05216326_1524 [Nitrosomonas marina]|uniref:Uncharacterized protein n=1 Tax=Nitrosomonas marina TaxID=917 RepID=A0A1I0G4S8_9PROT|nr:hypothetical protein SAMN05216326_1524 [Nitrosomonas marina]
MNSYFLAISHATDNGKLPEFSDLWRNYHPNSILSDSDYQHLTDTNELPLSNPVQV